MKRQIQPIARTYFAALIGLQAMFTSFLLWGTVAAGAVPADGLTLHGAEIYRPERELPIYVLSVIGTILLGSALARRAQSERSEPDDHCRTAWQCSLATLGSLCFIGICLLLPRQLAASVPLPAACGFLLLLSLAVIWSLIVRLACSGVPAWFAACWNDCAGRMSDSVIPPAGGSFVAGDFVILIILAVLVYIPDLERFAGFDFDVQRLHHWDFFVVGPAVGYLHGGSLGSQVYSQYGVGFPLIVALLAKWVPVTYPNVMRIAVITACGYYFVLYGFLRALLRNWKWACFGVLLAVDVQLFQGVDAHQALWQFPSSTIMRSPGDILVFSALLWDARSSGRLALAFASLLVGLALVFETDTGIYLAITLAVYIAMTRYNRAALSWRSVIAGIQTFVAPGAAALIVGLELAARGNAFSWKFLSGWLEVFRVYPSGIGMLPINMSADGLLLSFLVIGAYLAVACHLFGRCRSGRITRREALPACIAIYGLCYLCQFVGRSHPFNLFHSSIPVVILIVVGIAACAERVRRPAPHQYPILAARRNAAPILLAACVLVHILTLGGFRDYPNVLHPNWEQSRVALGGPAYPGTGVRVPVELQGTDTDFKTVVTDARRLSQDGSKVLFLVNNDPIYYLASGATSQFRYSPLFPCLLTKSAQSIFERDFQRSRIDYVFVPPFDPSERNASHEWDIRRSLHRIVAANYRLDHRSGSFEVWRHL